MNLLDEICLILEQANEPLHFRDITERLVAQKRWYPQGEDPAEFIDAYICEHLRTSSPETRRLRRDALGIFELRASQFTDQVALPPSRNGSSKTSMSDRELWNLVTAAYDVLSETGESQVHFKSIAKKAIRRGLVQSSSHNVGERIRDAILIYLRSERPPNKDGKQLEFQNHGDGRFSLARPRLGRKSKKASEPVQAQASPPGHPNNRYADVSARILRQVPSDEVLSFAEIGKRAAQSGLIGERGSAATELIRNAIRKEITTALNRSRFVLVTGDLVKLARPHRSNGSQRQRIEDRR